MEDPHKNNQNGRGASYTFQGSINSSSISQSSKNSYRRGSDIISPALPSTKANTMDLDPGMALGSFAMVSDELSRDERLRNRVAAATFELTDDEYTFESENEDKEPTLLLNNLDEFLGKQSFSIDKHYGFQCGRYCAGINRKFEKDVERINRNSGKFQVDLALISKLLKPTKPEDHFDVKYQDKNLRSRVESKFGKIKKTTFLQEKNSMLSFTDTHIVLSSLVADKDTSLSMENYGKPTSIYAKGRTILVGFEFGLLTFFKVTEGSSNRIVEYSKIENMCATEPILVYFSDSGNKLDCIAIVTDSMEGFIITRNLEGKFEKELEFQLDQMTEAPHLSVLSTKVDDYFTITALNYVHFFSFSTINGLMKLPKITNPSKRDDNSRGNITFAFLTNETIKGTNKIHIVVVWAGQEFTIYKTDLKVGRESCTEISYYEKEIEVVQAEYVGNCTLLLVTDQERMLLYRYDKQAMIYITGEQIISRSGGSNTNDTIDLSIYTAENKYTGGLQKEKKNNNAHRRTSSLIGDEKYEFFKFLDIELPEGLEELKAEFFEPQFVSRSKNGIVFLADGGPVSIEMKDAIMFLMEVIAEGDVVRSLKVLSDIVDRDCPTLRVERTLTRKRKALLDMLVHEVINLLIADMEKADDKIRSKKASLCTNFAFIVLVKLGMLDFILNDFGKKLREKGFEKEYYIGFLLLYEGMFIQNISKEQIQDIFNVLEKDYRNKKDILEQEGPAIEEKMNAFQKNLPLFEDGDDCELAKLSSEDKSKFIQRRRDFNNEKNQLDELRKQTKQAELKIRQFAMLLEKKDIERSLVFNHMKQRRDYHFLNQLSLETEQLFCEEMLEISFEKMTKAPKSKFPYPVYQHFWMFGRLLSEENLNVSQKMFKQRVKRSFLWFAQEKNYLFLVNNYPEATFRGFYYLIGGAKLQNIGLVKQNLLEQGQEEPEKAKTETPINDKKPQKSGGMMPSLNFESMLEGGLKMVHDAIHIHVDFSQYFARSSNKILVFFYGHLIDKMKKCKNSKHKLYYHLLVADDLIPSNNQGQKQLMKLSSSFIVEIMIDILTNYDDIIKKFTEFDLEEAHVKMLIFSAFLNHRASLARNEEIIRIIKGNEYIYLIFQPPSDKFYLFYNELGLYLPQTFRYLRKMVSNNLEFMGILYRWLSKGVRNDETRKDYIDIIADEQDYLVSKFSFLQIQVETSQARFTELLQNMSIPDQLKFVLKYQQTTINKLTIFKNIMDFVKKQHLESELTNEFKVEYIKLLCTFEKHEVFPELQTGRYPALECLPLCKSFKLDVGCAYLHERMGEFQQSLDLYKKMLKKRLKALVRGKLNSVPARRKYLIGKMLLEVDLAIGMCMESDKPAEVIFLDFQQKRCSLSTQTGYATLTSATNRSASQNGQK